MIWKQDGSIELWVEEVADEDGTYVREARRWSLDGRFRTRLRSLAVSLGPSGTLTLQTEESKISRRSAGVTSGVKD